MKGTVHKLYISLFFLIGILSLTLLTVNGFSYYSLPIEQRVFSAQHLSLKPSGIIGHGLGILGSLMMIVGVSTYMIRKRFRMFFHWGYLKYWLEFHIFLCTVGPLFVLYHTAFKFGGIVAVSFWSMVVVVLSGFAGRFIYVQIPRTIQGRELDIRELNKTEDELTEQLRTDYSLNENILSGLNEHYKPSKYTSLTLTQSLTEIIKEIFATRKFTKELRRTLRSNGNTDRNRTDEVIKIARTKITLSRRIGMLRTMQKLFRYWHIFHLPFALSMFIIMVIHVAVTIVFGYKWIF